MGKFSKADKAEWSYFISPVTKQRTYCDVCRSCEHDCKQSYHAQVIRCLRYDPKRAVCTAKNTGKKGGK